MSNNETKLNNTPHRFPCPGCGADLLFEPKNGAMTCPYCGRTEQLPQSMEEVKEHHYDEYLTYSQRHLSQMAPTALDVQCSGCGASTTFTPPEVAGDCPFCGATIVMQPKSSDPIVAPSAILPFAVPQRNAVEAIQKWVSTRWFAPNALKRMARHDTIKGVYLPYWTYDSYTITHYNGFRGEHYWEEEEYWETDSDGNRVRRTRTVMKTRWYPTSGSVDRWFDDVLVPATTSLPEKRIYALEPWDLDKAVVYEPEYLSGFRAQKYQVDIKNGFGIAQKLMEPAIINDIQQDIGGDEQRISHFETAYSSITFKHILLPVWLAAYRFNNKIYQVMVNARTAEVVGDRPYSFWKIAFLILFIALVLVLAYYFGFND